MKLLSHHILLRIFVLLIFFNTLILFGSQYFVYTKHWDIYWLSSFFYRETLLCVSYFIVFWALAALDTRLPRLSKILAWSIFILSILCFVIDIFLLYTFDTNLNSYLVIVALESNPNESIDFLHNYLTLGLFAIYIILLIISILIWKFIRPIHLDSQSQRLVSFKRYTKILYTSLACGVCIVFFMIVTHTKPLNEDWPDMLYNYTKQIYRAIDGTRKFMQEYKTLNTHFDDLSANLRVKKPKNPIENIALVIGESTQRDHLSLYGYPLQTTPRLDALAKAKPDNFFVFTDVISAHAQTHESLSLTLTFANQDSQGIATLKSKKPIVPKPWYEFLNIIDTLNIGGYESIAISNQEPVSLFGNAPATILKRAKATSFVNINDKMSTTKFDESVLHLLDTYLGKEMDSAQSLHQQLDSNEDGDKSQSAQEKLNIESAMEQMQKLGANLPRFYVLHLMGNHAKYYNRYPSNFAYFQPSDMLCQDEQTHIEENMHYDNSVAYGDFVLSEIIQRFEQSDSIVIFFSDHGEEIYDWRNFIGHSDSKISRFMVEIPFIIYVSDSFKLKHKELYQRIKAARNNRYMNDDFIHTLLDIAGIKIEGYQAQRSLISPNTSLLNARKRIVGDKNTARDYDDQLKSQQSYRQQNLCTQ